MESETPTLTMGNLGAGSAARTSLPNGTRLGRYVVEVEIGRGAMGVVYRATDPDLGRKVAIKLLGHDAAQSGLEFQARLLREAQAMARLNHPNVISVHDVGLSESGPFIAMELVEGPSLKDWLHTRRRPRREIIAQFVAAARGLAAAHAAGLVHRDFKPENVLVGDGRVRVTDFGLARSDADVGVGRGGSAPPALDTSASAMSLQLTRDGAIMGTPAYMAPEQFLSGETDARTDQFAFAASMYQALYGQLAFAGTTPDELKQQIVAGRIRAEPAGADVPSWLRRVLLRGLAHERTDRFQSMDALIAALEADPAARRRRWGAAALGAMVVILAVAGALARSERRSRACRAVGAEVARAWSPARRAAIEVALRATGSPRAAAIFAEVAALLDRTAADWSRAREDACLATTVRGEQSADMRALRDGCLDDALDELDALAALAEASDRADVGLLLRAAQKLPAVGRCGDLDRLSRATQLPSDPELRARARALRAQLAAVRQRVRIFQYDAARPIAEHVAASARALGLVALEAEALQLLAEANELRDSELEDVRRAIWLAEANHLDEVLARAATIFARQLDLQRRPGAEDWIHFAQAVIDRLGGDRPLRCFADYIQARIETGAQENAAALASYGRCHDVCGGDDDAAGRWEVALCDLGAAEILIHERRPADARRLVETTLARIAGRPEFSPANLAFGWNNLAAALVDAHFDLEALAAVDRGVCVLAGGTSAEEPQNSLTMRVFLDVNAGEALAHLERHDEAQAWFARALRLSDGMPELMVYARTRLGESLRSLGRLDEADDNLRAAAAASAQAPSDTRMRLWYGRARVALDRGRLDEAAELAGSARDLVSDLTADDDRGEVALILGTILLRQGRSAPAQPLLAQARAAFVAAHNQSKVTTVDALRASAP